jgi:hypothetical protein
MFVQHTSPNKLYNIIQVISCFLLTEEFEPGCFIFGHVAGLELGDVVIKRILGGELDYHMKTWCLRVSGITSSFMNHSICFKNGWILCGVRYCLLRSICYSFKNQRRVTSMCVGTKMQHKSHMHLSYLNFQLLTGIFAGEVKHKITCTKATQIASLFSYKYDIQFWTWIPLCM